jgi:hypothetical protein
MVAGQKRFAEHGVKFCSKCDEIKSLAFFNKNKSAKDGLQKYCTPCHLEMKRDGVKKKREADPETFARERRESAYLCYHRQKSSDPVRLWASNAVRAARGRAKRKNIEVSLDQEFIISIAPECCPVLGIPLLYASDTNKKTDNSPTIDRLDPNVGYIPSNISVISEKANRGKSDASLDQLVRLLEYVERNHS